MSLRRNRAIVHGRHHQEDLALILRAPSSRWTDALLSETRAQIGGCLNAIELAIILNIAAPHVVATIDALGPAYCRRAIEGEPQLLGKALVDHFRFRAALVLVARNARNRSVPPEFEGEAGEAMLADQPDPAELLAALNLAEARWSTQVGFTAPIRADLPADIYADLAWSAAALLVQACERQTGRFSREVVEAISDAVERTTARHDEGAGPFALAARCALGIQVDQRRHVARLALRERHLLLFIALAALELRITQSAALSAFMDDVPDGRIALLRVMEIDDLTALRMLEVLAPVNGRMLDDEAIAGFVEALRSQTAEQTETVLACIAGNAALTERLAMIERSPR